MPRRPRNPTGEKRDHLVLLIADRDGWYCRWCGIPLTLGEETLDHLVTRQAGGNHDPENLVFACEICNHMRGNATVEEWAPTAVIRLIHTGVYWRGQPETAMNSVPLAATAMNKIGTTLPRAHLESLYWELGDRVVGAFVHENANKIENRVWRLLRRAGKARHIARNPQEATVNAWEPPGVAGRRISDHAWQNTWVKWDRTRRKARDSNSQRPDGRDPVSSRAGTPMPDLP